MRIKHTIWVVLLVCLSSLTVCAQNIDLADTFQLEEIVVAGVRKPVTEVAVLPAVNIASEEINLHMGHSLMDALSHTEGVQAMDIGVGFSKPMIRGLGFQRVVVSDNGVKQEGQQWGADHGLEIDAFHVDGVVVIKGPASVLYGSDAMGGAIEILPPIIPYQDTLSGEILFQHQSVCSGLSGSAMLAIKHKRVYSQIRYTERHWGDYRVPADSFTYLSMRLPIPDRHLKNTAGMERSGNCLLTFRNKHYEGRLNISDNYQKTGFFSGAHGIPNNSNMQSDGDKWNIDLPYSLVNHLKVSSTNKWTSEKTQMMFVMAYQKNHREEWSKFHTHVIGQQAPAVDPDKELMLDLQTISAKLQFRYTPSDLWEHYAGISTSFQNNEIGGYSFLIPAYRREEYGAYYLVNYKPSDVWAFNASARYDISHIHTEAHGQDVGEVERDYHDYSLAVGAVFTPKDGHEWRGSIGRAYRLPSANELTSNGVHHGAFRHELGDSTLVGEQGWQTDLSYSLRKKRVDMSISPFFSYYPHFISLHPTGQWSMLPDAGQIYQYVDAPATFFGGEARVKVKLVRDLHYEFSGEYVHTYDHDSHTATPFSPPATMRNTISWERKRWQAYAECQSVATQTRVCHNEDETPGYNLLNVGGKVEFPVSPGKISLHVNARNILNTYHLNHLNFYRKIDLPEAGVDIQSTIRFTF
ncbi:MAG: TonB-dependent receptor [Paludibacteraceae bacterium]|nr:TonB-dependent receptor [Paludibacteraceae bacterium]